MNLGRYEPAMAPALTAAYNRAVLRVPHCYPVSEADLAAALAPAVGAVSRHNRLHSEAVFVTTSAAAMGGFVHAAVERPCEEGGSERGVIRFLWYDRGHREAGQALLAAAEECLRERGIAQIEAFPQEYRYPFYHLRAAYLSVRLDQVEALLQFNGYRRVRGEVFLDWPDYAPRPPGSAPVFAAISLEWVQGRGARPGLHLRAHHKEKQIAECVCVSCGEYSEADAAQDWLFTTWLGVDDAFQGKGLGRYLLERALEEMHGVGYRHAVISAAWDNCRAFLFYSNFGYHVVDWTYGLSRELKA